MRQHIHFMCHECELTGTIDHASSRAGLLIVSGGNELRSGAHNGMAQLAHEMALKGYTTMRYDRRGIGDSEGINQGYLSSADDLRATFANFRKICPQLQSIVAFGNCDAASALALFGADVGFDALVLANPWVIEDSPDTAETGEAPALPPPSAVRNRYLAKLKDPRSLLRLLSGQVDMRKLFQGLKQASKTSTLTEIATRLGDSLAQTDRPTQILLASRDRTAMAFDEAWNSKDFAAVRNNANIKLDRIDSSSHSFASDADHQWLVRHLLDSLESLEKQRNPQP